MRLLVLYSPLVSKGIEAMIKVCFVVNPFAGLGGPLALKGTDGSALAIAMKRARELVAPKRAERFVKSLLKLNLHDKLHILTAGKLMGSEILKAHGVNHTVVYEPPCWPTTAEDTTATVRECAKRGVEVVIVVGGDGTVRDALRGLGKLKDKIPILGVPAGVKMYSAVFALTPEDAARALHDWLQFKAVRDAEVLDIDEDAFRADRLVVKLYDVAKTLASPCMVSTSKQPSPTSEEEEENKRAIARYVVESMEECTLYILGPGTTVKAVADELGVEKTILGVDVVHNKRLVAKDVDEEKLYELVLRHQARGGKVKLILTPIGGQGFLLGRGNQQISPRILKLVGPKNIIVVATRSKVSRLRELYVDTGDPEVDAMLRGYVRVVVDYREEVVMRVR